jgi:hypothetical protein
MVEPIEPDPTVTVVLADQFWMHRALGRRRIDLDELATAIAGPRTVERIMVMPRIVALDSFRRATEGRGWRVVEQSDITRESGIEELRRVLDDLVANTQGTIAVVSGDPELRMAFTPHASRLRFIGTLESLARDSF